MKYAYSLPDGSVSIVIAAPKTDLERVLGPLTDEAYEKHVLERSIPAGALNLIKLPDDWQPPSDRTYRDAWHMSDGKTITVHMERAREIHRQKLRDERAPELAMLDVAYQRADEAGDTAAKKEIAARKQILRDAPAHPGIDAAETLAALHAVCIDC